MRRLGSRYSDCEVIGLELVFLEVEESQGGFDWWSRSESWSSSGRVESARIADAFEAAVESAKSKVSARPEIDRPRGHLIVSPLRNGEAKVYEISGNAKGRAVARDYKEVGHFPTKKAAWSFVSENRA